MVRKKNTSRLKRSGVRFYIVIALFSSTVFALVSLLIAIDILSCSFVYMFDACDWSTYILVPFTVFTISLIFFMLVHVFKVRNK